MKRKRILFVCMGNICRSPAAEGIFRRLLEEKGLADKVEVDSAGTIGYHVGAPPDRRMTEAARNRGIDLTGLKARKFTAEDFDRYDLIVVMDQENMMAVRTLDPANAFAGKVELCLNFHPEMKGHDVPDPYYGGDSGFENVLDLLESSADLILERLYQDEEPV